MRPIQISLLALALLSLALEATAQTGQAAHKFQGTQPQRARIPTVPIAPASAVSTGTALVRSLPANLAAARQPGIAAADINAIQGTSQAVLAAKHAAQAKQDLALHDSLVKLRASLEDVIRPGVPDTPSIASPVSRESSALRQARERDATVRSALFGLHRARAMSATRPQVLADGGAEPDAMARLEQNLGEALDAEPRERLARMKAILVNVRPLTLRDELRRRSSNASGAPSASLNAPALDDQPTISTITRHR